MMITKINYNKVAPVTKQPFDSATACAPQKRRDETCFEGARPAESEENWKTPKLDSILPSAAVIRIEGLKTNTTTEIFLFQVPGRLCALNAVANAMTIPIELYEEIKKQNPDLPTVKNVGSRRSCSSLLYRPMRSTGRIL